MTASGDETKGVESGDEIPDRHDETQGIVNASGDVVSIASDDE